MWSWLAKITVPLSAGAHGPGEVPTAQGTEGPGPALTPRYGGGASSEQGYWWAPIASIGPALHATETINPGALDAMLATEPVQSGSGSVASTTLGTDSNSSQLPLSDVGSSSAIQAWVPMFDIETTGWGL